MFFSHPKSKLGIDIGTSSIKVVELKKEGEQYFLETYGIANVTYQAMSSKLDFDVIAQTAGILKELLAKSEVTTKKVVASLPNNIVFISVIDVPAMSERELKSAIEWEARRYVPLPLEEVTLSWSVLTEPQIPTQLKVLLTAVPTTVIDNYLKMFRLAGLEPIALEIEALALIRSLVGSRLDSLILVDIGARGTSLNLVDKGFLRVSRNLNLGGETLSSAIANGLHISFARAEQFKKDMGLSAGAAQIPQTMRPVLDEIKSETMQLLKIFESGGGSVAEIIFAGAGSQLPGLKEYFADLGTKVSLGDPMTFINFNPTLKQNISQVSSGLAIALGLAMRD